MSESHGSMVHTSDLGVQVLGIVVVGFCPELQPIPQSPGLGSVDVGKGSQPCGSDYWVALD